MKAQNDDTNREVKAPKALRDQNLSKDGKWRSFPKVPNLLQYVSTATYFARVKVNGKIFRESLGTAVFTTAKLRLTDFLKEKISSAPQDGELPTFREARLLYEQDVEADHSISDITKRYRKYCLRLLARTWPELDQMKLAKMTETQCREWAARLANEVDEQYFNNTLGTLRAVLKRGKFSGERDPSRNVSRLGVKPKQLTLPEPAQFEQMLVEIETSGAGQARHCADLVRFLAFSGCRLSEARQVTWVDVDHDRGHIVVRSAKVRRTSNASDSRFVPIIPPMSDLLLRLQTGNPASTDRVCVLGECQKSLTRACARIGVSRITHHDLRHLFATRCIEAGVDIPTVSRWLGHSDGGALAMRTYGHLRQQHSQEMAQRVTFSTPFSPAQANLRHKLIRSVEQ